MKHSKEHPGFKAAAASISRREGFSAQRAGAILAAATRRARMNAATTIQEGGLMPFKSVADEMRKFTAGTLHSGSSRGPVVKSKAQALAISLSEQRKSEQRQRGKSMHAKRGK